MINMIMYAYFTKLFVESDAGTVTPKNQGTFKVLKFFKEKY